MNDYLCDKDTGDLVISDGDFLRGPSAFKHVDKIIKTPMGSLRRSPLTGVGAIDYLNAPAYKLPGLVRNINLQLEANNFDPNVFINANNELEIDV